MKWISELQTSFRLDSRPSSDGADERLARNPSELNGSVERIHEKLTFERPICSGTETLHHSIMAAVRKQGPQTTAAEWSERTLLVGWSRIVAAAGVVSLMVIAGIWLLAHRPGPKSPSADLQQELMALPGKAVSPLSKELSSLHEDLQRTTSFLMASVPEIDN